MVFTLESGPRHSTTTKIITIMEKLHNEKHYSKSLRAVGGGSRGRKMVDLGRLSLIQFGASFTPIILLIIHFNHTHLGYSAKLLLKIGFVGMTGDWVNCPQLQNVDNPTLLRVLLWGGSERISIKHLSCKHQQMYRSFPISLMHESQYLGTLRTLICPRKLCWEITKPHQKWKKENKWLQIHNKLFSLGYPGTLFPQDSTSVDLHIIFLEGKI